MTSNGQKLSREDANRANAQLSTGPRTQGGKAASCLNHLAHGLSGSFRILTDENPEEYAQLLSAFRDEHAPATITEHTLVTRIAQHQWLTDRALRLQSSAFDETNDNADQKKLALYMRYQTTHERAYYRALNQFLKVRKEMQRAEFGFESQDRKHAQEERREEMHQAKLSILKAQAQAKLIGANQRGTRISREQQELEDEEAVWRIAQMVEARDEARKSVVKKPEAA